MLNAEHVKRIRGYGWVPNLANDYNSPELTKLVVEYNKAGASLDKALEQFKQLDKELNKLITPCTTNNNGETEEN